MKSKKRIVYVFCSILCILSMVLFTGCGKKDNKTLVLGTNAEFPPFEYINNDGEIDGFDVAFMKAIGEEIGYKIKFTNMEFKSLLGSIQTNGIDAAIAGMTITEERALSVDFTKPYFSANQYIIVKIDNDKVTTLEELNGKKIAVQEGTTGDLICTPAEENEIITDSSTVVKRFKKGTDAVLELKKGGVDAVVIDSSPAEKFVSSNSDTLKYIPIPGEPEEYGIAVAKGNEELVKLLNEGIEKVKENGVYDSLINQYFGDEDTTSRKTSDNWFVQQYYTFKYIFIDTNGYKLLFDGLKTTLLISICAVILGVVLGLILALMKLTEVRYSKKTFLSVLSGIYIDIVRGTPVVVQLLIMYMIVFRNSSEYSAILAAITTFGLNSAAYVAEIIRAGILAVDNGQMEGGRSLGLTYGQTMRYIIIPQAIKNILPALGNEFIALIKETSIVGYVAIQDLTKASDFIISRTYETFMPLIVLAVIYYIIVKILTKLMAILERRLRKSDIR